MSASSQSAVRLLQDQEILGELLHSLSQPLTTLCCSLELSIEKAAGQQHEAVSAALEQAERVISQVRLLREYLDAELTVLPAQPVSLAPVLRGVVEQLSSVAAVNQLSLQIVGTSSATVAVSESRLRLALQYLVGMLIEGPRARGTILLQFEERAGESLLRAQVESASGRLWGVKSAGHEMPDRILMTSQKVRLAIASRVLESGGASLTLGGQSAFALRIPRLSSRPV